MVEIAVVIGLKVGVTVEQVFKSEGYHRIEVSGSVRREYGNMMEGSGRMKGSGRVEGIGKIGGGVVEKEVVGGMLLE